MNNIIMSIIFDIFKKQKYFDEIIAYFNVSWLVDILLIDGGRKVLIIMKRFNNIYICHVQVIIGSKLIYGTCK
jgi:hypothetical protein